MTTQESTTPEVLVSESPASWNTRYLSPEGFTCQLTLRAASGSELLARASSAIHYLLEHGCTPLPGFGNGKEPHPNGHNGSNGAAAETRLCPIHQVAMKHFEKEGRSWFSHKTDSGWCKGK